MKPLKFKPLLRQTIRGGDKITLFRKLDEQLENVGEGWEIPDVKNNKTSISEGRYEGHTLNDTVRELEGELIGEASYERFGDELSLFIKFIDAQQDLSIQIHPADEIARKQGKSRGEAEMWYIIDSDRNAHLRSGLKKEIMSEECKQMAENDTTPDAIADYPTKGGDYFFLPAGRIHSTGTGCLLAEIQQTPGVTYRIYDFKRKDKNGSYRELHTMQTVGCINYNVEKGYRTDYMSTKNQGVSLAHCPYFNMAVYGLNEPMTLDYSELDNFAILIGVKGEDKITDNEGNEASLCASEAILTPVTTRELKAEGTVKFLEAHV